MQLSDWIFDVPDLYADCSLTATECQSIGAQLVHTFNKFVNATNQVISHQHAAVLNGIQTNLVISGHEIEAFKIARIEFFDPKQGFGLFSKIKKVLHYTFHIHKENIVG